MTKFASLARRARALRAARAVTFSASIAGLAACGEATPAADAAAAADSGRDAASSTEDACAACTDVGPEIDAATPLDAGADAPSSTDATTDAYLAAEDAFGLDGGCGPAFPPTDQACCVLAGGFWDGASMSCAVAVPGPFVPPSLEA
jgi:hypothetical protein